MWQVTPRSSGEFKVGEGQAALAPSVLTNFFIGYGTCGPLHCGVCGASNDTTDLYAYSCEYKVF